MVAVDSGAGFGEAAAARRQALSGGSGPVALIKNIKVFGLACFACLGGWVFTIMVYRAKNLRSMLRSFVYGYNQGVISGILTMPAFSKRTRISHT